MADLVATESVEAVAGWHLSAARAARRYVCGSPDVRILDEVFVPLVTENTRELCAAAGFLGAAGARTGLTAGLDRNSRPE